jgi:hypothetical protein
MLGAFLCLQSKDIATLTLQLHCCVTTNAAVTMLRVTTNKAKLYYRKESFVGCGFTAAVQLQRCGLKSRHKQKKP